MYWFKRKYRQIKRVIDFLPLLWKGFDFDYIYAIQLFKKQLERIADNLESNPIGMSAPIKAQKIRTVIRLMDKVYEDEYGTEWIGQIEELYGKDVLEFKFEDVEDRPKVSRLMYEYEYWDNADEIRELKHKLADKANDKQKRAHKLLWAYIEHNIQWWWD